MRSHDCTDGTSSDGRFCINVSPVSRHTDDRLLDTVVLDSIPGPEHLAMANSLTFSLASTCRAMGPFLIRFVATGTMSRLTHSWCFAVSTRFQFPGRWLVWVTFFVLSTPSVWLALDTHVEEDERDAEERHELLSRG